MPPKPVEVGGLTGLGKHCPLFSPQGQLVLAWDQC